jgi:signal transduction histidine kinase/ActR/RegA family two-component response regulator
MIIISGELAKQARELAAYGSKLEEVVAERTRDRELALAREREARREAETANRAKDDFLAMLGHELRNPLAPIQVALHLMERLGTSAQVERAVIERQVAHLTRLVDDLLDVARITNGKVELREKELELAAAVAKGIELASPLLERREVSLVVDVPSVGLLVSGDLDRLAQVVGNLLTNAAKFSRSGGEVAITGERDNDQVVLRVRDHGEGIAPALLPQLFDAFVQGERRLDRSQGGLGLGLAIVRSIVIAHGGTISAHSEGRGHGSEFQVRLPLRDETSASSRAEGPRRTDLARAQARILVVDDNEDAAQALAKLLELQGHFVETAFDGPTALAKASNFHPQVALLDLGLPVMDGFEVAARLREVPGLSGVKLVAVTGYGLASDRERTARAGFHAHIVKPLDVSRIPALLATLAAP